MHSRRAFLARAALAAAAVAGAAVAGIGPRAQAAPLTYYVWYKQNGRYTGEGPYTRRDAYAVADSRRRQRYVGVYIGDKNGRRKD